MEGYLIWSKHSSSTGEYPQQWFLQKEQSYRRIERIDMCLLWVASWGAGTRAKLVSSPFSAAAALSATTTASLGARALADFLLCAFVAGRPVRGAGQGERGAAGAGSEEAAAGAEDRRNEEGERKTGRKRRGAKARQWKSGRRRNYFPRAAQCWRNINALMFPSFFVWRIDISFYVAIYIY
jgi:hypothetical protein